MQFVAFPWAQVIQKVAKEQFQSIWSKPPTKIYIRKATI